MQSPNETNSNTKSLTHEIAAKSIASSARSRVLPVKNQATGLYESLLIILEQIELRQVTFNTASLLKSIL